MWRKPPARANYWRDCASSAVDCLQRSGSIDSKPMSAPDSFFDTSVLFYLLSSETGKADRVEQLLAERGAISVQVLNEFSVVAMHKLRMPLAGVREILDTLRTVCTVEPVTVATHDRGLAVFERYKFSFYDSLIISSALIVGARVLYTEDLQHGQVIDCQLRVVNPFLKR
jgi:predicted nucleic acid-binding protein